MQKFMETEFTGRPRSNKNARSQQSYSEKQNIFYPERNLQVLEGLVQEANFIILPCKTALGRHPDGQKNSSCILLPYMDVLNCIDKSRGITLTSVYRINAGNGFIQINPLGCKCLFDRPCDIVFA